MSHRDITATSHLVGNVTVAIVRWRNANSTAFISVTATGPDGATKTWEAKSQGPSSGGYSKPTQAAERVYDKITGENFSSWGREELELIAKAAAAKLRSRSNPRRRGGRRNPESEVTELVLFITNDGDLYRQQAQPIMVNLAKKIRKGTYDATKAVKLWGYLADAGAQKYTREYDTSSPRTSYGAFSKADRVAAAKELAEHYAEELAEKAGTKSNPRYRRIQMARRKKSRRVRGYKGGVRVVRFKVRGRTKIVRFHKPGTAGFRSGKAKKRAAGKRLARKWGFFRKGSAIYQKRPGRKSKLIRRL